MFTNFRKNFCACRVVEYALPPQNLSLSPSEISELTKKGYSASSSAFGLQFSEGSPNPALMPENVRSVDPSDLWNLSKASAVKLVSSHKRDKEYYN